MKYNIKKFLSEFSKIYKLKKSNVDVYEINTAIINNIWWEDLNTSSFSRLIMTFERIHVEAIKLVKTLNYEK